MMKPASLRQAIAAAVPQLNTDPEKFLVFADEGRIEATGKASRSFLYHYTLNLMLLDFAGNEDAVFHAVVAWVATNERRLIENETNRKDGITFDVDQLTHETCDISIKVRLTERVVAATAEDGTTTFTHPPEAVPEWERVGLA